MALIKLGELALADSFRSCRGSKRDGTARSLLDQPPRRVRLRAKLIRARLRLDAQTREQRLGDVTLERCGEVAIAIRDVRRAIGISQRLEPCLERQEALGGRRARSTDALRKQLEEVLDTLGVRDLEKVLTFAEFVRARRASRAVTRGELPVSPDDPEKAGDEPASDYEPPSSKQRTATRG